MEFSHVESRFLFFNGKDRYAVEYSHGLHKWFVFKDEEHSNALMIFDERARYEDINASMAHDYLDTYLESLNL